MYLVCVHMMCVIGKRHESLIEIATFCGDRRCLLHLLWIAVLKGQYSFLVFGSAKFGKTSCLVSCPVSYTSVLNLADEHMNIL